MQVQTLNELSKDFKNKSFIEVIQPINLDTLLEQKYDDEVVIYKVLFELNLKTPLVSQKEISSSLNKVSPEESVQLTYDTQVEAYQERMQFLSLEDRRKSFETLESAARLGDGYKIVFQGVKIGFILVRPYKHELEDKILVPWIWAKNNLTAEQKEEFKKTLLAVIDKYPNKKFLSSVHFKNIRSLRFF